MTRFDRAIEICALRYLHGIDGSSFIPAKVMVTFSTDERGGYRHLRLYRDKRFMMDRDAMYVRLGKRAQHRKYLKDFVSARIVEDAELTNPLVIFHEHA